MRLQRVIVENVATSEILLIMIVPTVVQIASRFISKEQQKANLRAVRRKIIENFKTAIKKRNW